MDDRFDDRVGGWHYMDRKIYPQKADIIDSFRPQLGMERQGSLYEKLKENRERSLVSISTF